MCPQMEKGCEFVLDLGVHYSAGSGSAGAKQSNQSGTAAGRAAGQKDDVKGLQAADWVLNGTLGSRNCGVALSMNLTMTHMEKLNSKSIKYTLMMTAVSFIQVCCLAFTLVLRS